MIDTFLKKGKQIVTTSVVATTIAWSMGGALLLPVSAADTSLTPGTVFAQKGSKALWLLGSDGKAGFFANEGSYASWYGKDFSKVKSLSKDAWLTVSKRIGAGAAVPYRAGTKLVTIEGDPKVYAVEPGGYLRWIPTAELADSLYGKGWNKTSLDTLGSASLGYYQAGADVSLAKPPVGLLLKDAAGKWYIVDTDGKRELTTDGVKANKLDTKYGHTASEATLSAIPKSAKAALSASEDAFSMPTLAGAAAAVAPAAPAKPAEAPKTEAPKQIEQQTADQAKQAAATSTGKLMVSLNKTSPTGGYIGAGAAFTNFADIDFTSTGGDVVVTQVPVILQGIGSSTELSNIYLFDGSKRLTLSQTLGSGRTTFTSAAGLFIVPAGSTKTISIKADLNATTAAGKTYILGVTKDPSPQYPDPSNPGKMIVPTDGLQVAGSATIDGTFPVMGGQFNSASYSTPSLATLRIQAISVGTSLNAGVNNQLVGQFQLQAANSDVKLTSLLLTEVGTINASSDLANVKLMKDATQIGTTIARLAADGSALFDLSASPYIIPSGGNVTFSVYADVIGTPNREFRFSVQRSYDVVAWDTNYKAGILPAETSGGSFPIQQATAISVRAGNLVVNTDASSPTGNISTGINNTTVAAFTMLASGEQVKLFSIPVRIQYTNAVACGTAAGAADTLTGCDDSNFANLRLVDDKGVQLGSTFTTVSSATAAATGNAGVNRTVTFTFGSTGTPLNYVADANATRKLYIKADILSTMRVEITSFRFDLTTLANNAQGTISLQNVSTTANNGRSLTVVTSPFTHALGGMQAQTYVRGASNKEIGQFKASAGAGEGINVTNLTLLSGATAAANLQNLKVMINGVQFGNVQGSLANSTNYTFSGTNLVQIPIGGDIAIDVYADIQSGATLGTLAPAVSFVNAVGSGSTSGTARTSTGGTIAGQNITIAASGSLTILSDSSAVPANQVSMGSNDVEFASFKLQTGTNEGANLTSIMVTDTLAGVTGAAGRSAISQVRLYDGAKMIGSAISSLATSGANGTATFQFNPAFNISANSIKTLRVVANTTSYNSTSSASGSSHTFGLAANGDVVGTGDGSGASLVATGAAVGGNAQTVYRTVLTVVRNSGTPSGSRTVSTQDRFALFDFMASQNYDVLLQQFSITVQAAGAGGNTMNVRDANGQIAGAVVNKNATAANSVLGAAVTATGAITAGDLTINGTSVLAVAAGGSNNAQATNIVNAVNVQTGTTGVTAALIGTTAGATRVALYRTGSSGVITVGLGTTATLAVTGLVAATTYVAVVPAGFQAIAPVPDGTGITAAHLAINTTSVGAVADGGGGGATGQVDNLVTAINTATGASGVTAARAIGANTYVLLRTTPGQITIGGNGAGGVFGASATVARHGLTDNSAAAKTYVVVLPAGYTISAGSFRTLTLEIDSTTPSFDTGAANNDATSARVTQVVWSDQGGSSADLASKDLPIQGLTMLY